MSEFCFCVSICSHARQQEIQHAQKGGQKAALFSTKLLCESYPVSVVPGQFQESYRHYHSTELFYMPLNTSIFTPPKNFDGNPECSSVNLPEDDDNDVDEEDEDDEVGSCHNAVTCVYGNILMTDDSPHKQTMSTAASSNAAKQNVAADVSTTSVVSVRKMRRGGPGRGRKVGSSLVSHHYHHSIPPCMHEQTNTHHSTQWAWQPGAACVVKGGWTSTRSKTSLSGAAHAISSTTLPVSASTPIWSASLCFHYFIMIKFAVFQIVFQFSIKF